MDALCEEWGAERNRHPFYVEGFTEDRIQNCWEESSSNYTGVEYSDIREEIIHDMRASGILTEVSDIIDLGCGPGLYDFPFAEMVRRVHCVDGSPGMIARIDDECKKACIGNISTEVALWEDFDTDERFDVVFVSLCPALNNPESIMRMERYSKRYCAYVSSANPGPAMSLEVWRRLGKHCSFRGYDTHYPYEYLRMMGRDPELKFYRSVTTYKRTLDDAIEMQRRYLGKYREITQELDDIIIDVVSSHSVDGHVTESKMMTLGLLTWEVPSGTPL